MVLLYGFDLIIFDAINVSISISELFFNCNQITFLIVINSAQIFAQTERSGWCRTN